MNLDIKEYDDWLDRHLEGSLTPDDWVLIDKKIKEDPEFAKNFALDLAILRGSKAKNIFPTSPEIENDVLEDMPLFEPKEQDKKTFFKRWETWVGIIALAAFLLLAWRIWERLGTQKQVTSQPNSVIVDSLKNENNKLQQQLDSLKKEQTDKPTQKRDIANAPSSPTLQLDWEKRDAYFNKFKREEAGWVINAGSNNNIADWKILLFKNQDKSNGKALLAIRKILNNKPKIAKEQDADLCYYGGVLNLFVKPDTGRVEEAIKWLHIVKDTFVDKDFPPQVFLIEALFRTHKSNNIEEAKAFLKKDPLLKTKLPEDIQKYLDSL
jgi:cell division protein FtsB